MTYLQLKSVINTSYADFVYDYIIRKTIGADSDYSEREVCFVKGIYKVLMNQDGDETTDLLAKVDIQNCIEMFNIYSNSKVQIEYT
jgi:hypothetical protein